MKKLKGWQLIGAWLIMGLVAYGTFAVIIYLLITIGKALS